MRIIDAYIGRIIASTTFITLAVFVSVSGIIKFVEQMGMSVVVTMIYHTLHFTFFITSHEMLKYFSRWRRLSVVLLALACWPVTLNWS